MCNRDDLYFVRLNNEMNDVIESPNDRKTNVLFRRGELATSETQGVFFNSHECCVKRLPEFIAKSDSLRIEPQHC